MEPIKTPSNEALDLQIQALKSRMAMLETELDHVKDIGTVDNDRCIKWFLEQRRSIDRLWLMSFLVACAIILHNVCHFLRAL